MEPATRDVSPRLLMVIGFGLTIGFACAMVAAFHPSLSSVWTSNSLDAVRLIGEHRSGAWQLANWMFAVGIWFTVVGLAALNVPLNRRSPHSPLPTMGLTLAAAAAALWTVNLAFRLTVTARVADDAAAGRAMPEWYEDVTSWADHGLLSSAALIGGTAMILYGLAVVGGGLLARWTGWFMAGSGVLLIGEFVLTRDVVPAVLYLAPLPLGVMALIRAARPTPK